MAKVHFIGIRHLTALLGIVLGISSLRAASPIGIFEDHADVGQPAKAGSAQFDEAQKAYILTASGQNMWAKADAFHFAWKRLSGDVTFAADIKWPAAGVNAHRKACLIIRQSMDADSAYVDAAVHGDGLTSLQYRDAAGEMSHEVQANIVKPARVSITKQGDTFFMSVAADGQPLQPAGGSIKVKLTEPFYVGLAVCSHDDKVLEKAQFTNVQLSNDKLPLAAKPALESTLETINISSTDRKAVYRTLGHFEAPNWSPDGKSFIYNSNGRIFRLPREGGQPEQIDTAFADRCNNDHGISPDGTQLAISHNAKGGSLIYVLPISGGEPKQLTPTGPSYWHGWSPDGKIIVYCAQRDGEFDVYSLPVSGGQEKRLTDAKGLDDGPEYTADGKYIYFNSNRTGLMQIWRMSPDGTNQEQVTKDELNNWFAHPSPDGKWIVFLSYQKDVKDHPANKDVVLRMMPIGGGEVRTIAKLFGGQGTINVPSWSPDSKQVAFVSYRLVNPLSPAPAQP